MKSALPRVNEGPLDPLMVERVRLYYKRTTHELRELEAYKKKRGVCIAGISCTRIAVEGPQGGRFACAYHAAARKAGIKLARWATFESEYGRLRKEQREQEKAAREAAAANEKAKLTRRKHAA